MRPLMALLGHLELTTRLPAFDLITLFANGEHGGLYDPSDLSTLFQDANGTTPAVPGSPVGLVLDARQELGPVLNPWSGWTTTDGWDLSVEGEASFTGEGGATGGRDLRPTSVGGIAAAQVGKSYLIEFEYEAIGGGVTWYPLDAVPAPVIPAGTGKISRVYTAKNATHLIRVAATTTARIWNWSVREVLNPPLSQPTTAARPILARMPLTGRRNLLVATENLNDPAWQKVGVTVSNVGAGRWKIVQSSGTGLWNAKMVQQLATTALPDIKQSLTFYAEADGANYLYFRIGSQGNRLLSGIMDFTSGSVVFSPLTGSGSINTSVIAEPNGNGWDITIRGTITAGVLNSNLHFSPSIVPIQNNAAPEVTGDGVGGVIIGFPQREVGDPTPYQRVTNAYDVTEEGVPDTYSLVYDLADDALTTTLPQAINGDIMIAGTKGSIIEPVSYAAGSTFTIGPDTYTGGTPGIMRAIGNVVGVVLIDRTLTQTERENLLRHYKGKGAKGLLVPGPELVSNSTFDVGIAGWVKGAGTTDPLSYDATNKKLVITNDLEYFASGEYTLVGLDTNRQYLVSVDVWDSTHQTRALIVSLTGATTPSLAAGSASSGFVFTPNASTRVLRIQNQQNVLGAVSKWAKASVRELRPQEDW